ncbi:arginase [Frankineae bacterium MT45]|nr:arginase [Frankineae bacterium MT45]
MEVAIIGVPTSAGAHHAGQEKAPNALRHHGLVERLRAAGVEVTDLGDVEGATWAPDNPDAEVRNLDAVVAVAIRVADAVAAAQTAGRVLLVVGGDCTITVGVVAGLQRVLDGVRVAYFDGDADLVSPRRSHSGILDATGVAHLLGIADTALGQIGPRFLMLGPGELTLLGYDPSDADSVDQSAFSDRPWLVHATDAQVREDPTGCAQRALAAIGLSTGHPAHSAALVVHFDVDAVDSGDLALADYPHYGTGVPLEVAGAVLERLLATPDLAALVLTEVNPTHDPSGGLLDRYLETVATALGRALSGANTGA